MSHSTRISEFLLDIGAVRLNVTDPFTWTSGIRSPIYCDNRMVLSHPEAREYVVSALTDAVRNLGPLPDFIIGTATAGIAWGALVADRLNLPFAYVLKETKSYGAKKRIEGDVRKNSSIIVIEDLFSTGGSAISTAEALRTEVDAEVLDILGIFTFELPVAQERAEEKGLTLHALATITDLIDVAKKQGRITDGDVAEISRFIQSPEQWATVG